MTVIILLAAAAVLVCVFLNRISHKLGIPVLLAFILLGMVFGADGLLKIPFDNFDISEKICSVALIFIMFYGGFGTNWSGARPVAVKAGLLSTLGVVFTAGLTGLFCHFLFGFQWLESFLIGSVISSTDAASVFSILRSKKLGLKDNTDSMLELESGSNDPCSYMLTIVILSWMQGGMDGGRIVGMLFAQLIFGAAIGILTAVAAVLVLKRFRFVTAGFDMAFVIGIALLSYALASVIGGNGYLSAYLCGILLGNAKIQNKKALVHFFDGVTGLMQMLIFFLLGLLATPSKIPAIILPALGIMLFLTFLARPLSVFAVLTPFRCHLRQQLLVSFAGLRGAASIVFAIMAVMSQASLSADLYHIVFCIVLLSITFQGTLLPYCAKWLKMSDKNIDVMKTFSDYSEERDLQFIKVRIPPQHPWAHQAIRNITLPPDTLIAQIVRDGQTLTPNGKTQILPNDVAVISAYQYIDGDAVFLQEQEIGAESRLIGKTIKEYAPGADQLVIMVIRGNKTIIPNGDTRILQGDILVLSSQEPAT